MPTAVQRSVSIRGPKFFYNGAVLMFVFHYDSSTQDGPRVATHEDMVNYPDALRLADASPTDLLPDTEVNNPAPDGQTPNATDLAPQPEPDEPQPTAKAKTK